MSLRPVLDALGLVLDELRVVDAGSLAVDDLRSGLAELKRFESRLGAELARLTHTADQRNAWVGTGARDTAEWLGKATGTSTRTNRTAAELGQAMSNSDELTEAVTTGALSAEQAAAAVGAAGGEAIDSDLLDEIADAPLADIRHRTEQWRARRRPDAESDRAARRRAKRYLRLTDADDGMTRIDGLLDPASASIVQTTLDSIISQSAFDGSDRTRDQRRADALTQLAHAASKGDIAGGRSNARVLATASIDTVCDRADQPGRAHAGQPLDATAIRQLCCDAGIHRVITGPGSSILDFGHDTRLVTDNLFLALVARDQHCRWPGCTIRATWCDAHHLTEWQHGGRTAEDTCVLLCHHHHATLHQPGWHITGDAHQFQIHHPDGTTETSVPPPPTGHAEHTTSDTGRSTRGRGSPPPADGSPPPTGTPPRADEFGRETTIDDVLTTLQHTCEQLELV
ncbi:MAG: DUF222 domain-containing protein [Actinomycetota bacterium]